jgi:hypothetical protein
MEIYEILDAVATAPSKVDKMKVLADNDCIALRDILKTNFDNNIHIYVSKGIPWEPNFGSTKSLKDITKYLVPLSKGTIDKERADKSFKAMLEQIHPMDAQILVDATLQQLKYKGLTSKLIQGVWGEKIIS